MKGPKKKIKIKKKEEKEIRTRTIRREKKESVYPCVRICPRAGLGKTLILLDFCF